MSIPGTNTLLMGPPGTGKTHSLRTLIDAGLEEIFVIFTEPGMEVLLDQRNASDSYRAALVAGRVHYHYVAPGQASWKAMMAAVTDAISFDIGTLQKRAATDKKENAQFLDVLRVCENFKCQHCGKEFGNIDNFTTKQALVVDSLSGLNTMLLGMAAGSKPIITQPEWGQAMKMEEAFINKLALGTHCHFVLCAHVDRQVDMLSGGIKQMPSALGQKLPPLIGRYFSDVILSTREGDKFTWSLATSTADTKARNLPFLDKQEQSFVPIINQWKKANVNTV